MTLDAKESANLERQGEQDTVDSSRGSVFTPRRRGHDRPRQAEQTSKARPPRNKPKLDDYEQSFADTAKKAARARVLRDRARQTKPTSWNAFGLASRA